MITLTIRASDVSHVAIISENKKEPAFLINRFLKLWSVHSRLKKYYHSIKFVD